MNRNALIGIIIGFLVGLFILGGLYYFFLVNKGSSTPSDGTGVFGGLFLDGGFNEPGEFNPGEVITNTNPPGSGNVIIPRLRKIATGPVAGYINFDRKATTTSTTTESVIRFVEKATGHIFETTESTSTTLRISNTTFPRVHEAVFAASNALIYRHYNNDSARIESYLGSIVPVTPTSTEFMVKGAYLPQNISQLLTLNNKVWNIYESNNGSAGYIINPLGSAERRVFSSPLSEWNADWVNDTAIVYLTKPSEGEQGYAFLLNPQTGSFRELVGPVDGLLLKANSAANRAIYSMVRSNTFLTFAKDVIKNTDVQLVSQIFPEKCVWSKKQISLVYCSVPVSKPTATYPDDWYKGLVSFNDTLMLINTEKINESVILNYLSEGGELTDAIDLKLSIKEDYLYFVNKRDGSLWSYRLN